MTITEFLEARIAEDEKVARNASPGPWSYADIESVGGGTIYDPTVAIASVEWDVDHVDSRIRRTRPDWQADATGEHIVRHNPARVLAECAAKRAIIKQHEQWPVYVESEPSELEQVASGLNDITYSMTRQMAWLTTREYVNKFGVEPPTAPMIAALAAVYKEHPDYQQEWA